MSNLMAIRLEGEHCSCSGCGNIKILMYEIVGQYDWKMGFDERLFLCSKCFQPFKTKIDVKQE